MFLAYATPAGCAFLDRALYLPRAWTEDADRMAAAGVPEEIAFATKPALARTMIGRALDAGVSVGMDLYGHLIDQNLWTAAARLGDISGTRADRDGLLTSEPGNKEDSG